MVLLYTFTSAFSCIPRVIWYGRDEYSVADSESILLDIALISDTHSDSAYFNERSKMLRKAVCGISKTDNIPDAMVIAGDISNATDPKEYKRLKGTLSTFNKIDTVIPSAGNHDVRAGDSYEEAQEYFCDFASFCGIETEKTYYSVSVKGYPFIVLGSEDTLTIEEYISDEQLEWFEAQLRDAMKTGKPIFIINHQAMYNSNNVTYVPDAEKNWGVGEQSDELEAILRKYVPSYEMPVFFISGHLHRSFNEYTLDTDFCENLYCVTLPSVVKTEGGGLGMALEVYPDKILLRARNYIEMEWLEDYQYTVPLAS